MPGPSCSTPAAPIPSGLLASVAASSPSIVSEARERRHRRWPATATAASTTVATRMTRPDVVAMVNLLLPGPLRRPAPTEARRGRVSEHGRPAPPAAPRRLSVQARRNRRRRRARPGLGGWAEWGGRLLAQVHRHLGYQSLPPNRIGPSLKLVRAPRRPNNTRTPRLPTLTDGPLLLTVSLTPGASFLVFRNDHHTGNSYARATGSRSRATRFRSQAIPSLSASRPFGSEGSARSTAWASA